jgi:TetR/AcrR family acrAB operon transcriptional repressor
MMPVSEATDRPARVLAAAARLIAHFGYDKTTVDDIAREAGVSKGALYLHWKSKDALFEALLIHEMSRLLDDLSARIEADPEGGTLPQMYRHALLALQGNPLMRALYTQDSRILGDYVRRQGAARYTGRFLFGKTFVQQLQAAGLLRADLSPEVVAYLMSIISYGFIGIETIIPASEAPPLEEVAAGISALMQSGFAGPGGESAVGKQALLALVALIQRQYSEHEAQTGA